MKAQFCCYGVKAVLDKDDTLVTFLMAMINCPMKATLGRKGLFWLIVCGDTVHHGVGKEQP